MTDPPDYGGSLFVSDLAQGLFVTVTPLAPFPTSPIIVPVQGSGIIGVTTDAAGNAIPIINNGNTTDGSNPFGGRIVRILPDGVINTFAYGFDTNGSQDASSFVNSMLSISLLRGWNDACTPPTTPGSGNSRPRRTWPARRAEP